MEVSNHLKEPNQFILKYRFNFFLTLLPWWSAVSYYRIP